jgi:hypothetical protein
MESALGDDLDANAQQIAQVHDQAAQIEEGAVGIQSDEQIEIG